MFAGARRGLMPDFILRWTDEYPAERAYSSKLGTIEAAPDSGRTGEHRPDGFALVLGRAKGSLGEGGLPPLASNADFAGFVSHLLGVRTGG
jgi:hypothetical protein